MSGKENEWFEYRQTVDIRTLKNKRKRKTKRNVQCLN